MTYETLYQEGYRDARFGSAPKFRFHPPSEYLAGYQRGRKLRFMQKTIEFTVVAAVTFSLATVAVVLVSDAIAARLPV